MLRDNRRRYQSTRRKGAGDLGRKVLAKLLVVISMLVLLGSFAFFCYGAVGQSSFFQITDIKIEGCQRLSKKEILELSRVDVHSNLAKISSLRVQDLLEDHLWVERAMVTKEWPDRLTISIRERRPVAMVNLEDGLHYVDQAAVVFAPVAQNVDLDYPVITGLVGANGQSLQELASLADALLLIKYASRDNPNLPAQNISEINIQDNDLVLFLMDRPFPIRLGQGDIRVKYNRLVKVLYWLYKRKEFTRVSYVYVDYAKDKVLVGMGVG